ncbi:DNA repair protein RAD50, partial [Lindgomyces ingoldianus]
SRSRNSEPKEETQYLTGLPLAFLFFAVCLSAILIILDVSVLSTAIPSITTYFGTVEDVDWYGTAYLLCLCSIQPLTGQIYNNFRVKITYIVFLLVFELGSLICALSKSSKSFIVGRAVSGIGGAGVFNGGMVIITAAAPPAVRPQMLSMSMAMVGIGGVIGPVVGGAITQHLGWRWCMWIFLPPGAVVAIIFVFQPIRDQMNKPKAISVVQNMHHKFDLIGFALFTPACVMFLLAMSWGGSKLAWNSATVIGLLSAAPVVVGIFVWWIWYRQDRALIPPGVIMKPVVFYACLVSFLQGGAFLMTQYYLPLWFQSVKGADPEKGGIMMLPTCITQILSSIGCTLLLRTIPYAPAWGIFGNVVTAVGTGLMTTFNPSTPARNWIGYQILNGVGRGIAMQMPVLAVQAVLPTTEIAIATANMLFFQYFGGAVANCIAKTIFLNALRSALGRYAPSVDAQQVIHAGATEVFHVIDANNLEGVVKAYNEALVLTFWLPTAAACIACASTFGLGWQKVSFKGFKGQDGD